MDSGLDLTLHAGELAIFFEPVSPAGVGTHSLVALGSAMFVAIPVLMGALPGGDGATRVIQGVAAGIGFLGAGEIFRGSSTESGVHGLTSAAALWATAALGILAVYGSGAARAHPPGRRRSPRSCLPETHSPPWIPENAIDARGSLRATPSSVFEPIR